MDQHNGLTSYHCPRCRAEVTWRLTETPTMTVAKGDAGSDRDSWRVQVEVERWLPEHQQLIKTGVELLVRPDGLPRLLNRSLYSAEPAHEPTLAEAVAQIPATLGGAAGAVAADLVKLLAAPDDCETCITLITALANGLVSAFVALLLEPVVTPVLLFLQCVSVISALLPGGDISLVDMGLIRRWTGGLITQGVDHLACWHDIAQLCADVGLVELKVEADEPQAGHLLRQVAAQMEAAVAERQALSERVDRSLISDDDQEPEGLVRAADTTEWWPDAALEEAIRSYYQGPQPGGIAPHGPRL